MNLFRVLRCLVLGLAILLLVLPTGPSLAQSPPLPTPTCAWPFAWTPFGLGNWLLPDTGNRWWYMPIDASWQRMTITGAYPRTRFFSIAVYEDAPVSSGLAGRLYDAQIAPDPGSGNPFAGPNQTYTLTVTRSAGLTGNVIQLHSQTGWLVYRLYLPNEGEGSMGGVPLPEVRITDASDNTTPLKTCQFINRQSELAALQPLLVPAQLETPPPPPPVPDHIWFGAIATPPARLLTNPDNKYMASFSMPAYEPGRVIVIRGKAPAFPDTYNGSSVWEPAPGFEAVQMRFWSLCLADMVSPLPVEGCAVDASTPLDRHGFYTIVISGDALRPAWLPEKTVWLPWGDEQMVPKLIFVRHLLPSPGFKNAVQNAVAEGCGLVFNFPAPLTQEAITTSGQCSRQVMGDYYPIAVWCDVDVFKAGGWRSCFRAADVR